MLKGFIENTNRFKFKLKEEAKYTLIDSIFE